MLLSVMKSDEYYIQLAIDTATKSTEPLPCGVVIVSKEGEILAREYNKQRSVPDATAHAEICAIRAACLKVNSKNLEGATIYGSCEPCIMCLTAILYAKFERAVYAASLVEATHNNPSNIKITSDEYLAKSPNKIELVKGILNDIAMNTLYNK